MQLTQQTDYALRVLMYIGANSDRLVNITEVAEFYDISRSHLTKIVANLANSGYLTSIRGHNGGLRLSQPAESINIGKVIRDFEPFAIVDCMGTTRTCVVTKNCLLKGMFQEAVTQFLNVFDQYYLSDLLANTALRNELLIKN